MSTLPASWGTLYALTRLTDEQFEPGIESGIIHAGARRFLNPQALGNLAQ